MRAEEATAVAKTHEEGVSRDAARLVVFVFIVIFVSGDLRIEAHADAHPRQPKTDAETESEDDLNERPAQVDGDADNAGDELLVEGAPELLEAAGGVLEVQVFEPPVLVHLGADPEPNDDGDDAPGKAEHVVEVGLVEGEWGTELASLKRGRGGLLWLAPE